VWIRTTWSVMEKMKIRWTRLGTEVFLGLLRGARGGVVSSRRRVVCCKPAVVNAPNGMLLVIPDVTVRKKGPQGDISFFRNESIYDPKMSKPVYPTKVLNGLICHKRIHEI